MKDELRVLVLFGGKGSGKDTVGRLLIDRHDFFQDSFAAPLKRMVAEAFPFKNYDLWGPSTARENQYEEFPFSGECLACGGDCSLVSDLYVCTGCQAEYPKFINPRIALKTLGTEWGRRLFRNIWTWGGFQRAERLHEDRGHTTNVVFTDGRFPNELEYAKKQGAKTVLLLRNYDDDSDPHPSERLLRQIPQSEFHHILPNVGELGELPRLVKIMLADLGIDNKVVGRSGACDPEKNGEQT